MHSMASKSPRSAVEVPSGALRGLAILGIFLHNYAHLLPGIVTENEYSFVPRHVDRLLYHLAHPTAHLPLQLLSFFGHYGVPIFLFLSAYGLERKYAASEQEVPVGRFIASHYAKLWVMMLLGFVPFLAYELLAGSTSPHSWSTLLPQLALVSTLRPFVEGMVWPGPYWYFPLMVQIYAVYRLFLFRRSWLWALAMLLLCQGAQHIASGSVEDLMWLRYNFIGSMLPFVLGLLWARHGRDIDRWGSLLLLLLSSLGLFFGSQSLGTWLWVPALVPVAAVSLMRLLPEGLVKAFGWLGGISSAIFVFHPLVRRIVLYAFPEEHYLGLALYAGLTLLTAWLLQPVIHRATGWVARRLK